MKNNSISESDIFELCQSEHKFPVDFELAWRWIGYSRKDSAKRTLLSCGFVEGIDLHIDVELGTFDVPNAEEHITLTVDCLKTWAMMANTEKGREVRLYFLECERKLKQILQVKSQPERIDICNLDERTMHLLLSWQFWRQFPTRKEAYAYFYDPYSPQIGICTPYEAATLDDRLKLMSDFVFEYVIAFDSIRDPRSSAEGRQRCLECLTPDRLKAAKDFQHQIDNPQLLLAGKAIEYPDLASRQRSLVLAAGRN